MVKYTPILQILWKKGMQTNSGERSIEELRPGVLCCRPDLVPAIRAAADAHDQRDGSTAVHSVGRRAAPAPCWLGGAASCSMLLRLLTAAGKLKSVEGVDKHPKELLLLDVRELSRIYADFGGVQMLVLFVSSIYGLQFCEFWCGRDCDPDFRAFWRLPIQLAKGC